MPPVTVDAMVEQALTRVHEVTDTYPSSRGPMYRRVGVRQRQLYIHAAQLNADYYGASVVVPWTNGGTIDLLALDDVPELLQRVEIADHGTSSYANDDNVAVVSLTDPFGELAPRVTVRRQQIAAVGTDLNGVASLRLWYARLPAAIPADDPGTMELALDQPWDVLLELDLAKWVIAKASALPTDQRTLAISGFAAEESQLMGEFDAHLKTIVPTVQRYLSPLTRPNPVL